MLTPCKIWAGGRSRGGYGVQAFEGKTTSAHRVAYCKKHNLSLKDIEGKDICHKCDVRLCINEDHLFLGTRTDNMRDAKRKGRMSSGDSHRAALKRRNFKYDEEHAKRTRERVPRGSNHAFAKLTEPLVLEIRKWYKEGMSQHKIAKELGVTQSNISMVCAGRTWAHVGGL